MDQKKFMETARAFGFPHPRLDFAVSCSGGGDVDSFLLTIEAQERVVAREKGSCCDPRRASQHAGDPRTAPLIIAMSLPEKPLLLLLSQGPQLNTCTLHVTVLYSAQQCTVQESGTAPQPGKRDVGHKDSPAHTVK